MQARLNSRRRQPLPAPPCRPTRALPAPYTPCPGKPTQSRLKAARGDTHRMMWLPGDITSGGGRTEVAEPEAAGTAEEAGAATTAEVVEAVEAA